MKKTFFLLLVFAIACMGGIGDAKALNNYSKCEMVNRSDARFLAFQYRYKVMSHKEYSDPDINPVVDYYEYLDPVQGYTLAYVFNFLDDGWIVVSGCTSADPVIAYSDEGEFDFENMPGNMRDWLQGYVDMIMAASHQKVLPSAKTTTLWNSYMQGVPGNPKGTVSLMTSKWGQGDNHRPTYNLYCPVLWGEYCITGCLPTAFAQIVRYWQFPKVGANQMSYREMYTKDDDPTNIYNRPNRIIKFYETYYDYDNMPDKLTSNSDSVQIKATALLNFHIGVVMKVDYGVDGTTASPEGVAATMAKYFKYKRGILRQRSQYSDDVWMDSLRAELDNHRPVFYDGASPSGGGSDAGGHAFVCHGYNGNQNWMFKFNWGWDGYQDGYYNMSTINGLTPGSYNFCERQAALFGLEPPDDSNRFAQPVAIAPVETSATVFNPAYPNPALYTVTIPYTINGTADGEMRIFDITGRLVETVVLPRGNNEVVVNVTGYPKGVYLYRTKGGKTQKFIVQ